MPPDELNSDTPERPDPGFAPSDITDGRPPFQWRSRWDGTAWRHIIAEAVWLVALLCGGAYVIHAEARTLPSAHPTLELHLLTAAAAGLLGGTIFGIKWFYHVVAKGLWHIDRV